MLKIQIKNVAPGMRLALAVPNPAAPTRKLLHADYRMTDKTIRRLQQLGVRDLWIRFPPLDHLCKFVDPEMLAHRAVAAEKLCAAFDRVQGRCHGRLDFESYSRHVAKLVRALLEGPGNQLFLDEMAAATQTLVSHCSTVGYLSLLMGLKLDAYLIRQRRKLAPHMAKEVTSLGLGAMLHDVGMLKLDPAICQRHLDMQIDEPAWCAHAELGYEMVHGRIDPMASCIVLHHHQAFDGTGFPVVDSAEGQTGPLQGEKIHVFARIAAVADAFDTLQHPRPQVTVPTVRVLGQMIRPPLVGRFDPQALAALLAVVPPYAPGTILRLSDDRYAVAIDHNPDNPCRPRVQLIDDPAKLRDWSDQETEGGETIDLRQQPHLSVAQADGEDVSADNFPPLSQINLGNAA